MQTNTYTLYNRDTHQEVEEYKSLLNNINTLPLDITYDYTTIGKLFSKDSFTKLPLTHLKYQALYPINNKDAIVSLSEGNTPLFKSKNIYKTVGLTDLYFKYEGANPTGAFKDRGTCVEITKALEYHAQGIVLASTGNMAASVAAYAARANIPCYVFIPDVTPITKLAQAMFYGANIIKIKGNYDQAALLAEKTAEELNLFLAGDYVFRTEGQKSQAYEIIEQLDFKVPDFVVVPTGNGTNIYAIWKGFKEYHQMRLIDKMPHMIAVQSNAYNPIVTSFKQELVDLPENQNSSKTPKTVASAIAVNKPSDGNKVLHLIKESEGYAVDVSDSSILGAQIQLAQKESIFVEPSSSTALAALKTLQEQKVYEITGTVVCLLSGCGLKDPFSAADYFSHQITAEPEFTEIKKVFLTNKWIK